MRRCSSNHHITTLCCQGLFSLTRQGGTEAGPTLDEKLAKLNKVKSHL